ncbi:SusC/RagA family TonB-linked outer membrane protein [Sunxiuqinia elliptica]|uniref:TonB-linked outer membrane protein, SusC/RagA family n=1 Tax=Sunxiuqinia elliptica TaxID=655355 RepID=A0A1I2AZI0_9BACT|nr:SusC/RagA family TonB-linked outer membrane protein [Sunxiuqinia elliptica]SFE49169.1 TonB-linked outer membrane protein, SusC/RagA family [Sunxiuqinia elliptica]
MKKTILLMCLALIGIIITPSRASAQSKAITGHVMDAENQEPLPGVSIVIKGTTEGTMTTPEGFFKLEASPGQTLQFSFIGYATQEIVVNESNTINVNLKTDVQAVDEIMVTAEFGMKRVSRSIGSSVQNIKAKDITDSGRESFISALQGRVAGLNVSSSGGTPGSSTTVVLRSITSISGNNQPLYVVDGIPMNNSTFNPGNLADGGASFSVRNLDFASRGNDFNPEDIESMTVLKGAAAAALYGSDASNGAIIITTKKGTAGRARVSYSNSFKWDKAYGYPDLQTKYANGARGTTNYYYSGRYGGLYPQGMELYNNIESVLRTGFSSRQNVSIEGGSDKASLRASASFLDQEGVVKTTDYSRMNVSLSGKAKLNDWIRFEGSMQFVSTENTKVPRGTSGPLYMAMRWPIVDDMSNYMDEDGSHMRMPNYYTDTDLLNPLFGMYKNKLYDESDRFISSFVATISPIKDAFLRAQVGWDVGTSTYETSIHPYYYNDNGGVGRYNLAKSNFSYPTLNLLTGYNKTIKEKFYISAQFGYHQIENGVSRLATYGSNYAVIDFQSINNVDPSTVASTKRTTTRRVQALSGQVELAYNNMAFVTLRARNDWSSTLPVANNSYFYPAIEGAFIATELPFLKDNKSVSYLKLRGSVAQVGKDAGPLEIDPQLEATELTGGGYQYGYTGPNKNLRPEMTTSYEIGFEGRFANDRINTDFTYFWTHCEDQIVKGFRLSYATGFVLNNMNVGTFDTWGWEGHIDADIIQTNSGLSWNVGINASHTKSEVVYLPENVTEYYNAYTWNSGNIRNGIMVGHPVTTLTGRAYSRNDAGQILINPTTGLPIIDETWSVIGDREPKLRFGFTTRFNYKGFSLSALLAGRYKATVVNGTKRTMMQRGTSWESVDLRESGPVVFDGVLRDGNENTDTPTKNNIGVTYDVYGSSIYTGQDEDWLEKDVNYLRLQELRLSYRIPSKLLRRTFISRAIIHIAGNDLATWTNYSGIDAVGNTVSAAAGGTGGEGYDVWSIPNPRGYSIGLNVTF